jgi:hypothetical protein
MQITESTYHIPKHNLVTAPPEVTAEEWLRFAVIIHANNLGLNGKMVLEMSQIHDVGGEYVIGFKCAPYEEVKQDADFQRMLKEHAKRDIDNLFEGGNSNGRSTK